MYDFEAIDDLFCCHDLATFMKAYFDESGKHKKAPVTSIFGITMSAGTCNELQRRWLREAAQTPEIPLPFHMSDCEVGRKAFEYLKDQPEVRAEMQRRMIRTLRGLEINAYGMAIIRSEHALIADEIHPEPQYRDPWFLAFEAGISEMMLGSAESGRTHRMSFVFDRQDEFKVRAHELYDEVCAAPTSYHNRLGGLTFEDKITLAALQAVDIVVYEATKYLVDCKLGGQPERWQSQLLRDMIDITGKLLDKDGLGILREAISKATIRKSQAI